MRRWVGLALTFAIVGWTVLGGDLDSSVNSTWAADGSTRELVERADAEAQDRLSRVPEADRHESWHYYSALLAVSQRRYGTAWELSTVAQQSYQSTRAWLLRWFLHLHEVLPATESDRSPERVSDRALGTEAKENRVPPAEDSDPFERGFLLARPPVVANKAAAKTARDWIRWTRSSLGKPLVPFRHFVQVHHFGAWPPVLPAVRGRGAEPGDAAPRLQWLRAPLPLVLQRLSGATPERLFGSGRAQGRWLLLSVVRASTDLSALQESCERLWNQVASDRLVIVWLLELSSEDPGEQWKGQLRQVRMPLFVITTRDERNFGRPGFDRGGVTLFLDPDLELRASIPPVVPLPILHGFIAKRIEG